MLIGYRLPATGYRLPATKRKLRIAQIGVNPFVKTRVHSWFLNEESP